MRIGCALCCLAVAAVACGRADPDREQAAVHRRAARRALEVLDGDRSQAARRLAAEIDRAERLVAEGASAEATGHAWARAATYGGRALHERARARERAERYRRVEAEARSALAEAATGLSGQGAGRPAAAALSRARLALGSAAGSARAGDLQAAEAAVARALGHLEPLRRRSRALGERFADPALLRRWEGWVEATAGESRRSGRAALVVDKLRRRLLFLSRGRLVRELRVELGTNGLADKLVEGDRATPEGRYRVVERKAGSQTTYHRALLLDYPNEADRRRLREAVAAGLVPAGADPGGLIEIHGGGGRAVDWTDGCVALADSDMEWVFERVRVGTPVTIVGTVAWP